MKVNTYTVYHTHSIVPTVHAHTHTHILWHNTQSVTWSWMSGLAPALSRTLTVRWSPPKAAQTIAVLPSWIKYYPKINDNQCIQSSSIIILVSSVKTHRWRTRDNKPSALPYTVTCVHVTNHPQRVCTTHDIVCKAMFYAYFLLTVDLWHMLDEQLTYICMATFASHCERGSGVLGIKYIHVVLCKQNFLSGENFFAFFIQPTALVGKYLYSLWNCCPILVITYGDPYHIGKL